MFKSINDFKNIPNPKGPPAEKPPKNYSSSKDAPKETYIIKMIIIGNSNSGKTALMNRFQTGEFIATENTIGVELAEKTILIPGDRRLTSALKENLSNIKDNITESFTKLGGTPNQNQQFNFAQNPKRETQENLQKDDAFARLEIWDTSGSEKFRQITASYYKHCVSAFVVFDITNRKQFEDSFYWFEELKKNVKENAFVTLIGAKLDLALKREVSTEEATQFAKTYNVDYYEISSETGQGVEEVFRKSAIVVRRMMDQGEVSKTVVVKKNRKNEKSQDDILKSRLDRGNYSRKNNRRRGNQLECCHQQ